MAKSYLVSQVNETFFTAVGCMDGRIQDVIARFGREKFEVLYSDTITEAGLVGLLARESVDEAFIDAIKFKLVDVSIGKHHAAGVIVHGHAECAGNPVSDEQQKEDIRKSVEVIKSLVGSIPVIGVFVRRDVSDQLHWISEVVTS